MKSSPTIRVWFSLVAVASLFAALLLPAAASADRPVQLPTETVTFGAPNPCTGEFHEVTLVFGVRSHQHRNGFVDIIDRSGTTSDGFEMRNGREIQGVNFNNAVFHSTFMDLWFNADTGQKFRVHGVFVAVFENGPPDPTEIRVENFSLTCIGGPTLLP